MKRLNIVLSKVLEIDENQITMETSPKNVETWDSFNGLMLVSELENVFKVKFTTNEVTSVTCVKDIVEALRQHGVILHESS